MYDENNAPISPLTLAEKIKAKEIGVVELTQDCLRKCSELLSLEADEQQGENKKQRVFTPRSEQALAQAKEIEKKINEGQALPPLAGIPVLLSEQILMKGEAATAGSSILQGFISPFGATVADKLTDAGMIAAGRTVCSEFGIGAVHNLITPVLTGIAGEPRATGFQLSADSDGSVRALAAARNICFIKPTYGTVSRFGLVANASSMEQIGVAAPFAEDGFAALSQIAGYDAKDGTSYPKEAYTYTDNKIDLKQIRIGVLAGCEDDFTQEAVTRLIEAGAQISAVSLPHMDLIPPVAAILSAAEASNNISRFDGVKFGARAKHFSSLEELYTRSRTENFGPEAKLAALVGCLVLSEQCYEKYYHKAMQIRRLLKQAVDECFKDYGVILLTTGQKPGCGRFEEDYRNTKYTALANLTGIPAVSLPVAVGGRRGGVQLMAGLFGENTLLPVGKALQKEAVRYEL